MTPLPAAYRWLDAISGPPKLISVARGFYGIAEAEGPSNNPIILGWARDLGLQGVFTDDSAQAWCGLFAAEVCKIAGKPVVTAPLWALNWTEFGQASSLASLGDVLVFERRNSAGKLIGGHVGFYVAEDTTAFHVLGGNEANRVNIVRVAKARLHAVRRPIWAIAEPASVLPHHVSTEGQLSMNEA